VVAHLVVEVSGMKSALGWTLGAIVVAGTAWAAAYLYWHIKIVGALRTLETQAVSAETQVATDVLNEAGCRSLPYLVGALDARKNTTFLTLATTQVAFSVAAPGEPILYNAKVYERMQEWRIEPSDSPAVRQKKCDLIRDWWRDNGAQHHQTWRIWSSQCAR
jgi:hypothetical protein